MIDTPGKFQYYSSLTQRIVGKADEKKKIYRLTVDILHNSPIHTPASKKKTKRLILNKRRRKFMNT